MFIKVPDFGETHSWRIPAKLQANVWSLTTCKTQKEKHYMIWNIAFRTAQV
jgi:hypothetical protein